MVTIRRSVGSLMLIAVLLGACSGLAESETPETLTLIAHDSFASGVTDETFAAFTNESGIEVNVIAAGDAGALVNQAILTKDNPLADVLFGVDDTFLSRALDEEIFVPHEADHLNSVDDEFEDQANRVTPVNYGDVCINYDKAWFASTQIQVPTTLDGFRANLYASFLTVQHPATSSPGLAFMLSTIAEFGEDGWLDFWQDLKDNDVNVVPDWDSAYYADFIPHGGTSSMVVSYASSPPAEVIFASEPLTESPTGVIEAGCYRQVEYAGVLNGTKYPEAAGLLVDFMLSRAFQETIPLTWFVFPINSDAALPQEFVDFAVIPESPARLDPTDVAENRERWINEWILVMGG